MLEWLKRSRFWLIVLLVVLGAVGYYFLRPQQQAAQPAYQTVRVERGNLTLTVGATGTVRARQSALLNWQTSGIVEKVLVKSGDRVQKDQVLASLLRTSLPQNIILAEADLVSAQRQLEDLLNSKTPAAQAWISLREAQKAYDKAKEYYDSLFQPRTYTAIVYRTVGRWPSIQRIPELKTFKADRADEETIATAKSNLDLAAARLEDAKRTYERLKNGPDAAELAQLEARIAAAQATLNLARLSAPFDGVVTRANVLPGDIVNPGTFAFRIDDLSHLYVDVNVSEVDVVHIRAGQQALLTFDAIPEKEYHGIVTEISLAAEQLQNVVNYRVTIEMGDADEMVRPGMTAAVSIVTREIENALLIPNRAVRLVDGKYTVYVLQEDGTLKPVAIRLAASGESMSILEGDTLPEGTVLVLNPPTEFRPGPRGPFGGRQ
uniref:Efflux transporter, RND family, MFP subunit n=1 Tax=uncultured Chloroflexota bacterium TaxID=166587 RepID=H5SDY6_9CHLR|nr:efflux transporter, RND family, MFP subunit [uncultured Chloroflexota bacterium]